MQVGDGLALFEAVQAAVGGDTVAEISLRLHHAKAGPLLAVGIGIDVEVEYGLENTLVIGSQAAADE